MSDDLDLELEVATPEVVPTPEPEPQEQTAETDTVEETDEQKNERVQKESAARAEKRSNSIQKRMDELTADKYAERKRADELAENNARLMAMIEENKTPQKQAETETEPQREHFNSDLDYFKSLAKYEAKQETIKLVWQNEQNRQSENTRLSAEQQKMEVAKDFRAREAKVEKELPDYKEVIEDWSPRLPNSTAEMILRLPDGPLIAYHLAKNPDLEKTLLEQPEYLHGVTLGQMLATIKSSSKTTSAPAASKTVGTTSSSASDANEYRGEPENYMAWAVKNLRKR